MKRFLAVLSLPLLLGPVMAQPDSSAANIKADMAFLASDELKGREAGTPEFNKAADYVAARMKSIGLEGPAAQVAISSRYRWWLSSPRRRRDRADRQGRQACAVCLRQGLPDRRLCARPETVRGSAAGLCRLRPGGAGAWPRRLSRLGREGQDRGGAVGRAEIPADRRARLLPQRQGQAEGGT